MFTTSGTYPWSFVTPIFHNGQPSHGGDRKTFEVMTSTYLRGTIGSVASLLAAILIGTTISGISYQLRDIYSICRCCWNVATYEWKVRNGKMEMISFLVKVRSYLIKINCLVYLYYFSSAMY